METKKVPYKDNLVNEIRIKRPKEAIKMDYEGSRSAAIDFMCFQCYGGEMQGPKSCKSYCCPLWRFRPGADKSTPPGIPPKELYEGLIEKMDATDGRVLQGKKLAADRNK